MRREISFSNSVKAAEGGVCAFFFPGAQRDKA